jgi:hypothetical protein
MKTATRETLSDFYIIATVAILGILAFISAILISWPALAYLSSQLFV